MKAADTLAREYFGGSREEIGESVFDEFVALIETDRDEYRKSLRVDELRTALHDMVLACRDVDDLSHSEPLATANTLLHTLAQEGRDE